MVITNDEINAIITNPWATPGDIEAIIVEIQNENYADPRVAELLELEAEWVLAEYLATKGDE